MATAADTSAQERWEKENAAAPKRKEPPTTVSSVPIDRRSDPFSLRCARKCWPHEDAA